ncbi:tyrosine-type recombinase/integrase [Cryptosporangium sp. NPDC051539]|uniref:site-specific integrase n=1 Tax=Cryptosporangium sp. NPDC051539 TaxID=3363962 RepID=UPI0037ACC672
MKSGSVYKRCPHGNTGGGPSRPPACKQRHGSWYYVYDLGAHPGTGERVQGKKGGFATAAEAREACTAAIQAARTGMTIARDKRTVAAYLATWLDSRRGPRLSTMTNYRGYVKNHINPTIGAVKLQELAPDHIDEMMNAIVAGDTHTRPSQPAGVATANRVFACLRKALNDAMKRRPPLLHVNPCASVELEEELRDEVQVWEADQIAMFLRYISSDAALPSDRRLAVLYRLVLLRGLCRGEAIGLSWPHVNLKDGVILVRQAVTQVGGEVSVGPLKTRSRRREIALDAISVALLRTHRKAQQAERLAATEYDNTHGLVFARADGHPETPERVSRRFKAVAGFAGLPVIRLHDGRHSAATLALDSGDEMRDIQELLGHSTGVLTMNTYTHVRRTRKTTSAAAAAKLVDGNATVTEIRPQTGPA